MDNDIMFYWAWIKNIFAQPEFDQHALELIVTTTNLHGIGIRKHMSEKEYAVWQTVNEVDVLFSQKYYGRENKDEEAIRLLKRAIALEKDAA